MFFVLTKSLPYWRKLSEVNRGLSFFLPANGSRIQFQTENLCWKKYWCCLGSFSTRAGQGSGEGSLAIQCRCPCIELTCKKRSVSINIFWWLSVICSLFSLSSTLSAINLLPILLLQVFPPSSCVSESSRGQTPPCRAVRMAGTPKGQEAAPCLKWAVVTVEKQVCIERVITHSSRPVKQQGQRFAFLQLFPKEKWFISSLLYLCLLSDYWMPTEEFIRDTLAAAKRASWIIEPAAHFFCLCSLPTMKN